MQIHPEICEGLEKGQPIVALETAIFTHGLPSPKNWETAQLLDQSIREEGAIPAIIGILEGKIKVGFTPSELESLLGQKGEKVQARYLSWASVKGITGGTTVSATIRIAHLSGISIFATGGIGGVHREAERTFDISEDLNELAKTPISVISAGAKAILNLPLTLEKLESLGVPVLGFQTKEFPAFYTHNSGLTIPSVSSVEEVASMLFTSWNVLCSVSGFLICNPPPKQKELPGSYVEELVQKALDKACESKITGKELTPFLLDQLEKTSKGKTVATNIALVESNARLAAKIARAYSQIQNDKRKFKKVKFLK